MFPSTTQASHTPRLRRAVAIVAAIGIVVAGAAATTAGATPASAASLQSDATAAYGAPFWSDDFTGDAGVRPDADVWTTEVGNRDQEGWGNNELQYYTASAENSSLDGSGHLVIQARKANSGSNLPCWPSGDCAYTSARLTTMGTVSLTYGRVDVAARLPTGTGLLPAIWMLGNNGQIWPAQGEIDIAEVVGGEPQTVYGTAHGPSFYNEHGIGGTADLGGKASDAFHLYSIEKQPNRITWLVDNTPYFTLTPQDLPAAEDWVFEQDMHLLLNVAVGGDWPGNPSASTAFPATMTVDSVRMYGEGFVNGVPVSSAKAGDSGQGGLVTPVRAAVFLDICRAGSFGSGWPTNGDARSPTLAASRGQGARDGSSLIPKTSLRARRIAW